MTSSSWRWRHHRDTGKKREEFSALRYLVKYGRYRWTVCSIGVYCTIHYNLQKLQSKYIYKLNSAFRAPIARAAIKQLLLGGDRHRSCLPTLWELRLIIFWLISWTPYTNVSFCNILSTLSRFIRLCKMNVQDFVIFVMLGAI